MSDQAGIGSQSCFWRTLIKSQLFIAQHLSIRIATGHCLCKELLSIFKHIINIMSWGQVLRHSRLSLQPMSEDEVQATLLPIQLPAGASWEAAVAAPVPESKPPMGGTWMEFWAPGSRLAQPPSCGWHLGSGSVDGNPPPSPPSLHLSN